METLEAAILQAIDHAMGGEFDRARAVVATRRESVAARLTALFEQLEQRERDRTAAMTKARHDLGNALSIARSSVEAMLDGIVGVTDPRLNRLRELLAWVSDSMYALTAESAIPKVQEDASRCSQIES